MLRIGLLMAAAALAYGQERAAVETWVASHQRQIMGEFDELLRIPNVGTDHANIRRNAEFIRGLLERHRDLTGSPRAAWILERWDESQPRFIKVFPHEYKRVLGIQRAEAVYSPPTTSSPVTAAAEVHHG